VRASDAERDRVIAELGARFGEGFLSQDTFAARVDAAIHARDRRELRVLIADLPEERRFGAVGRGMIMRFWRRAVQAIDRWTRKQPAPLILPASLQQRYTIGREADCDMTLTDATVSRWHASLAHVDGSWLLADLGSTNGTRVNGWRVKEPTPVVPGDFVSFGAATFVIRVRAAAQAGQPA
jgi:Domain of unknown function (DUF1707)/Inner membrane component of T3SS, cytoplasmic domain